jgi:hypothetical protein
MNKLSHISRLRDLAYNLQDQVMDFRAMGLDSLALLLKPAQIRAMDAYKRALASSC